MTKKHYEAIADILKRAEEYGASVPHMLADYFATDNPKFDRTRFLQACGIDPTSQT